MDTSHIPMRRGKPLTTIPVRYDVRVLRDTRFSVGLDLGGTSLKAGVVDDRGRVVRSAEVRYHSRTPDQVFMMMHTVIDTLRLHLGDQRRVLGVGLLVPGPVNAEKGVIVRAANMTPEWSGF